MDRLYIVIPAYNEEKNIESVIKEWHKVVLEYGADDSKLVVIDDGSKDNTYNIMLKLKEKYPCLVPLTKENQGHGPTLLYGYQYALNCNADFVFQTDSDGQTLPKEFDAFWNERNNYDMVIGWRKGRQDGISRIFVTKVLKLTLLFSYKMNIKDANTPYRLMNAIKLREYIKDVPENYNLSNVLLAVLFQKYGKVKYIPITFRPRQGGVNSINMKKIFKIGLKAKKDFKMIKL